MKGYGLRIPPTSPPTIMNPSLKGEQRLGDIREVFAGQRRQSSAGVVVTLIEQRGPRWLVRADNGQWAGEEFEVSLRSLWENYGTKVGAKRKLL